MATFIFLGNMTDEGAKGIKSEAPGRQEAVHQLVRELGGEIKANYMTMGLYDRVVVIEFPDGEDAARFAISLGSKGFVRTTTLRAFSADEAQAIIASAP